MQGQAILEDDFSFKTSKTLTGIETACSNRAAFSSAGFKTSKTLTGIETGDVAVKESGATDRTTASKHLKPLQGLKRVFGAKHQRN